MLDMNEKKNREKEIDDILNKSTNFDLFKDDNDDDSS